MRDALPPSPDGYPRRGLICQACGRTVVITVEGLFDNPTPRQPPTLLQPLLPPSRLPPPSRRRRGRTPPTHRRTRPTPDQQTARPSRGVKFQPAIRGQFSAAVDNRQPRPSVEGRAVQAGVAVARRRCSSLVRSGQRRRDDASAVTQSAAGRSECTAERAGELVRRSGDQCGSCASTVLPAASRGIRRWMQPPGTVWAPALPAAPLSEPVALTVADGMAVEGPRRRKELERRSPPLQAQPICPVGVGLLTPRLVAVLLAPAQEVVRAGTKGQLWMVHQ